MSIINNVNAKRLSEDMRTGEVIIWTQEGPEHELEVKYVWFSRAKPDGNVEERFGSGSSLNAAITKSREKQNHILIDRSVFDSREQGNG